MQSTDAATVINKLKNHFARHGIPDRIVSDNGPQYSCHEFAQLCKQWDIVHTMSSPGNSKANGKAESAVKVCKQIMRKCKEAGTDPFLAILDHRNTPTQGLLSSPAQRLMSRRTKTLLPTVSALLRPEVVDAKHTERDIRRGQHQQATYYNRRASDLNALDEGDTVRLQPFRLGRKDWARGTVVRRLDERSYLVDTPTGVLRRNRQHIKKTNERCEPQPTTKQAALPDEPCATPAVERPADTGSCNESTASPAKRVIQPAPPRRETSSPEKQTTSTRSGRAVVLPARYRE